jgi:arylsulfatase A-like enzyme
MPPCSNHPFRLLAVAVVLVGLCSACRQEAPQPDGSRPNIIYIMSDDHALRTIGAYGHGINRTPNIDRLAAEGVLFTNAFVANSICGPSRASILTGKHSHKNGVTGNGEPWDSTQMVFPRLLKDAGYQTALIGKWHLNSRPADEFGYYKILTGAGKQGFYYNPAFYASDTGPENQAGYSTDLITDEALRWLEASRDTTQPFLLLVQYKAPHVPRMPPLRLLERYVHDTIPEPATLHDDLSTRSYYAKQVNFFLDRFSPLPSYGTYDPKEQNIYLARMTEDELRAYHAVIDPQNEQYRQMKDSGQLDDPAAMRSYVYQRFIKDYLRIVDALDENIGRLLDWVDADASLRDNTVVVYASDQGYFTGEHGYAEKRLMYEEALHMPLLMRWPGAFDAGSRVDALVQNIDFAPTFLDMAGVPVPESMQGRSFLPLLRGETPPDWREAVYYHYYDHMRHVVGRHAGVRSERYKLIHFYTDDVWEFYDLAEDSLEVNNVYGRPEYQAAIEAMQAEYERLKQQYDVPRETFAPPFEAVKN